MFDVKRLAIIAVAFALISVVPLYAQFSSPNYRIDESYIGPGGYIDSSSALYTGRASLGEWRNLHLRDRRRSEQDD